ncbi:MAG TPA: glycosyltransferase family 2 protein [Vicinamibacterales bacterium]|nr:glycosyltransferase family 2 protein [Vicinamibacterales bacterium]
MRRSGRALEPTARAESVPPSSITVVIPTRDEEGGIAEIIEAARPSCDEILVIDGHSSDRTREIAAASGARVVLDQGKGKGGALRQSITEAKGDILVFIDADGSHDARDIPAMVAPIKADQFDMVVGSRGRGGSDELHGTIDQFIRYVGSQLIMLAINYRWNVRLTDSQNGFRAIRRDVAAKLGLTSNLTTIEQEITMKALKQGYRVGEIPSHEYERRWGKSKVVVWKLWFAYLWSFARNII